MKITQLTEDLIKFTGSDLVNVYLVISKKLIIDAGNPVDKIELKKAIDSAIGCDNIKHTILTHFHYDHAGNIGLFPNARVYASKEEIKGLADFGLMLTFNKSVLSELSNRKILDIKKYKDKSFEYIKTPRHTPWGLSIIYKDKGGKKYLFSGDVMFRNGIGRTDFPSSIPGKMEKSLNILSETIFDILLPGHDY